MKQPIQTSRGDFYIHSYGDPNQPPLILVHGWPQSGYSWHHAAQHIPGYYVLAPDLRGFGDSNRELGVKAYAKDELGRDIFAIADALGIEKFALGGHDWGSAIVQEMAFLHPERIQKLILINMVLINNPKGQAASAIKGSRDGKPCSR